MKKKLYITVQKSLLLHILQLQSDMVSLNQAYCHVSWMTYNFRYQRSRQKKVH